MKRFISGLTAIMLAFSAAVTAAGEEGSDSFSLTMQIGSDTMSVNEEQQTLDSQPVIIEGRTLVPIRAIIEAMGGEVEWNSETETATLTYNGNVIELTIDSTTAYLNGTAQQLDTAPQIINGRTMLPIRFIAESFEFAVDWNSASQTISITRGTGSVTNSAQVITEEDTGTGSAAEIRSLYEQVLSDVAAGNYTFPHAAGSYSGILSRSYFLYDMDNDGVLELIVGAKYEEDVFFMMDCLVFDIESGENGYTVKQINGDDFDCLFIYQPVDGNGLIVLRGYSRGTGQQYMYRFTIESGRLSSSEMNYDYLMYSEEDDQYKETNPAAEWIDISDLSGLDKLN